MATHFFRRYILVWTARERKALGISISVKSCNESLQFDDVAVMRDSITSHHTQSDINDHDCQSIAEYVYLLRRQ